MGTRSPSTTGDRGRRPGRIDGRRVPATGASSQRHGWVPIPSMPLGRVGSSARPGWVASPSRSRANRPNDTFSSTKSSQNGGGIEALRNAIIRKSQSLPASQFLRNRVCLNFGLPGFTADRVRDMWREMDLRGLKTDRVRDMWREMDLRGLKTDSTTPLN